MSDSSSGPPAAANGGEEPTVGTEPIVGSSEASWANGNGLNVCPSPSLQASFTSQEDGIATSVSASSTTDVHSLLQSSDVAKSPTDATSQSSDVHLHIEQESDSKCSAIPMPTDDINRVLADSSELPHLQDCHRAAESVSIGSLEEKELHTCPSLQIQETDRSQTRFLTGESDLASDISPHMLETMSVPQQQSASVILNREISDIGKESSIRELAHSELVTHATSDESSIHMQDLEQDFKNIDSSVISHFNLDESQSPELIIPDSSCSTLVRSTISGDSITGICLSPPHTTNVYIPKGMGLPPVSTIIRSSALAAAKGRFDNPYPSHDLNIGLPSSLSKTNSFAAFSSLNVQRTIIDSPSPESMIKLSGPNLSLSDNGDKNLPTTMVDAKMLCVPYSQTPHSHITSRVCDTSSIIVTSATTSCLGPESNIPHPLLEAQSSASKDTSDVTLDHPSLQPAQIHIGTLQEVSTEKDSDPNADISLSAAAAVTSDSATTDETSDFECVSSLTQKNHETVNSDLSSMEHIHQVENASVIHSVSSKDTIARDTPNIQGSQLPELIRIVNDSRSIVQHMTIQNVSETTSPQVSTSIPPIRTLLATQKIKPSSSPFAASPNSGHITEDANAQSQETDKLEPENTMASLGIIMEPSNSEVSDNLSAAHEIALQLAMETAGSSSSASSVNSSGVGTSVIQQFLATESTQGRLSSVVHHPPGGVIASVVANKIRSPSVVRSIERHILHSPSVITAPTIIESNKAPNSTMTDFPLTSSTVCGSGESAVITCAKSSVSTVSSLVSSAANVTVSSPLSSIASVALPSILSSLSANSLASLQANLTASSIQSIPLTLPSLSSASTIQPNLVSPSIQSISPLLLPSILSSAVSTSVPSIKQEPEENITVQEADETVTSSKTISETSTTSSMYAAALSTLPSLLKTDGTLSGPLPPFTVVSGLPPIVKRELGASLANTFLAAQGTLPSGLLTVKQEKQETDLNTMPSELNTTLPSLVLLPSVAPMGLSKIATSVAGASNPMSTLTTPVPSQSSTVAFPSVAISTAASTPSGTVTTPTVLVGISATTTVAPATSKDTEVDDKKLCCMMCRNGSPCGLHPTQTQGTSSQGPLVSTDPAKPFRCQLCGKHLASKNVYQLHMRSHSGEKPFTCNLCGHHFSQKTSLTRHMRSHTGERPFPCEVCGKRFADKERIKIHMRTHTGEKPFACEVCGKRFSQKSTVKRHMSVHTGEKPFKCEVCGKGFANRGNLNAHSKTHANT